ncbi:hypothetical protein Ancab_032928 [Ancistrocladus abbreviatus]
MTQEAQNKAERKVDNPIYRLYVPAYMVYYMEYSVEKRLKRLYGRASDYMAWHCCKGVGIGSKESHFGPHTQGKPAIYTNSSCHKFSSLFLCSLSGKSRITKPLHSS